MPPSKNPRRYADAQRILDVAILRGEAKVSFTKPGQVVHMAQRLNLFQSIMERVDPATPYANFMIRRDLKTNTLTVIPRTLEAYGGTIIDEPDLPVPTVEVPEPMSPREAARKLLEESGE